MIGCRKAAGTEEPRQVTPAGRPGGTEFVGRPDRAPPLQGAPRACRLKVLRPIWRHRMRMSLVLNDFQFSSRPPLFPSSVEGPDHLTPHQAKGPLSEPLVDTRECLLSGGSAKAAGGRSSLRRGRLGSAKRRLFLQNRTFRLLEFGSSRLVRLATVAHAPLRIRSGCRAGRH